MKNVFRLIVFIFVLTCCCFCVFADDVLPDGISSPDSIEGSGDISYMDSESNSDSSELLNGDTSIDTLIVNELVIEGEDEAAALAAQAEIYSISPDVQYGAYFHANISNFGDCYIYIPVAYASDSFSYNSSGIPINITSSTITGYIAGSNSNQSIQFPSFGVPRYRTDNYNQYVDITRWSDIDSTVSVYTDEDNFYSYPEVYFLRFLVMLLAADLILNMLIRLLGGVRS